MLCPGMKHECLQQPNGCPSSCAMDFHRLTSALTPFAEQQAVNEAAWELLRLKADTNSDRCQELAQAAVDAYKASVKRQTVARSESGRRYSEDFIRDAIDAEPELPGEMPDAMWEAMKDREYCTEAMRIAVRQTKRGIKERLFKGKP